MFTKTSLAILAACSAGQLVNAEDAQPVTGNPVGVTYKAVLPDVPFFSEAAVDGNIKGSITASAPADGDGVRFLVAFDNFPKEGGPFS